MDFFFEGEGGQIGQPACPFPFPSRQPLGQASLAVPSPFLLPPEKFCPLCSPSCGLGGLYQVGGWPTQMVPPSFTMNSKHNANVLTRWLAGLMAGWLPPTLPSSASIHSNTSTIPTSFHSFQHFQQFQRAPGKSGACFGSIYLAMCRWPERQVICGQQPPKR